jgi:uncharacterized protein (DUF849 family)
MLELLSLKTPFELMVAPNGARLTKLDHPKLPILINEISDTALACAEAGANAIHIHVRDSQNRHSLDPKIYAKTVKAIRSKTSIHLQISSEAAGIFNVYDQKYCLENSPVNDVSVSLSELERSPELFSGIYNNARIASIDIQHILYDAQDLKRLLKYYDAGIIPEETRRAIFVLGKYKKNQISSPKDISPFLEMLGNQKLQWSVCAFGLNEHQCLLEALNLGGDVRIGFENNTKSNDGTVFENNESSVETFVEAADKIGFKPKGANNE